MDKADKIIETIKKQKAMIKTTSIFVDKVNRKEYLTFNKFELKYKIKYQGYYLLSTKDDIKEMIVFSKAQRNELIKDENLIYYEFQERKTQISNKAGTLLCDFLNCDFREYESLKMFTEKYSIAILIECLKEEKVDIEIKMLYSKIEYDNLVKEIAEKYGDILERIKSAFIFDIDNCYNIYNEETKREFTPYQIYTIAINSNKGSQTFGLYDDSKIYLECDADMTEYTALGYSKEKHVIENMKNEKSTIIPSPYIISSLDLKQILFIEFKELLCIDKFPIRKCQNCEKYFVTEKRTDELYCNNIFENTGKSCKEIGFLNFKKRKLKQDDVARLYRNTYQQKLLRVKRNPDNKQYQYDLDNFRERYKEVKEQIAEGKMTREEFKEWLLRIKK